MQTRVLLSLVTVMICLAVWIGAGAAPPATQPAEVAAHWKAMFPQGLIDANGSPVDLKQLQGKIVGLYFSARSCIPCKVFMPKLVAFRDKNAANFEVVFVSGDDSKDEQRKFMAESKMKWPAMEWRSEPADALARKFAVSMLPTLIILGPDGKEITRSGRADVTSDPNTALSKWQKAAK